MELINMDGLFMVAVVAAVVLVALVVLVATIQALIVIVPPNRAAVITGRNRQLSDGQQVGYRSITGAQLAEALVRLALDPAAENRVFEADALR